MPSCILSVERFLAPYRYAQEEVTGWVRAWLDENGGAEALRLLSVYASAGVETRASVVPIEEVFFPGDFETQNDRYARDRARTRRRRSRAARWTSAGLERGDIGLVVSVSCTGFMIPAVDAYVADALGLGPRLVRLPITESGCAGGVVGLARATDYLAAHPDRAALVLALEFSSLTFQRWDRSATNVVSTAIFGDGGRGGGAGRRRTIPRRRAPACGSGRRERVLQGHHAPHGLPPAQPGPADRARPRPGAVRAPRGAGRRRGFLDARGLAREDVTRWILHPGGRRIIEVMSERLGLREADLAPTEAVLSEHGNMSSVTVLFVLDEILRGHPAAARRAGRAGRVRPRLRRRVRAAGVQRRGRRCMVDLSRRARRPGAARRGRGPTKRRCAAWATCAS